MRYEKHYHDFALTRLGLAFMSICDQFTVRQLYWMALFSEPVSNLPGTPD